MLIRFIYLGSLDYLWFVGTVFDGSVLCLTLWYREFDSKAFCNG